MIDSSHPGFDEMLAKWDEVDRVSQGKELKRYLRSLKRHFRNSEGMVDDDLRQREYEKGAVFYNVTGYTLNGLLGTMFRRSPTIGLPAVLEYAQENVDGKGNSLTQHARRTASNVIRKGRAGLWVDYPAIDRETSRAEISTMFATIHMLQAQQIVNWSTIQDGSNVKLGLVVMKYEKEMRSADGYSCKMEPVIRELRLTPGESGWIYQTQEWTRNGTEPDQPWVPGGYVTPLNAQAQPLDYIPFQFVGSENNDYHIDHPPLMDLARLNVAHYRNSADYEDNVWYAGQAQPWMSGATEEFYEMAEKYEIRIGSRQLFPVPSGEQFGFATPDANPQSRQAMQDKVEMMIGIGARFITPGGQAKTAFEAESDREVSHSVLSTIAQNVSDAYTTCLRWMLDFMPADGEEPQFMIEHDYSDVGATPQLLAAWVKSYIDGAVPQDQYIGWMQRQGYFDATLPASELADLLNAQEGGQETDPTGSAGGSTQ